MKAYKGFNRDMTCRGFQYVEGETYELPDGVEAKLCESGFHACEMPLDCFYYYKPNSSVFHEVDLEATGEKSDDDNKRVGHRIKIGARLSIKNIVDAQISFVHEHINKNSLKSKNKLLSANSTTGDYSVDSTTGNYSANSATGDYSTNSATGYCSANSITGRWSANSATGNYSANSATDDWSANSATGDWSANSATGYCSANSTTGYGSANSAMGDWSTNSATDDYSANSATGNYSINSTTGNYSVNSTTGYGSVNVSTGGDCENSGAAGTISVGWGVANRCKGDVGAYLVLCERDESDGEYPMIGEPVLIKIDGKTYKADTWYMLKNGEVVECE